jgi:hypothetical protein
MLLGRRQTFRASSPVGTYWLSRCTGFTVEGRDGERATVEDVVFPSPLEPAAFLVVRRDALLAKPRTIAVDEVVEVDPWQQRLRLRGSLRGAARRARRHHAPAPAGRPGASHRAAPDGVD